VRSKVFGETEVDELQRTVRSFVFKEKVFKFEIAEREGDKEGERETEREGDKEETGSGGERAVEQGSGEE
jgi:hypothetical protein